MQTSFTDRRMAPVGNTFIEVGSEDSRYQAKPDSGVLRLRRSRSYAGYVPHDLAPLHAAAGEVSPKCKGKATTGSGARRGLDAEAPGGLGEREEAAAKEETQATLEPEPDKEEITTLMLRNLPKNLTQRGLMEEVDKSGFGGLYDFCYLPHSFANVESRGFAFINFTSAGAAGMFVGSWHRQRRCGLRPHEPAINISPAVHQGLVKNMAKWDKPRLRRIRNPDNLPFMRLAGPPQQGPSKKGQAVESPAASRRMRPAGVAASEVMDPRAQSGIRQPQGCQAYA